MVKKLFMFIITVQKYFVKMKYVLSLDSVSKIAHKYFHQFVQDNAKRRMGN